jgi:hypothetical protein
MLRWRSSSFRFSSQRLPIPRLAARPLLVVHLLVVCSLLFSAVAAATLPPQINIAAKFMSPGPQPDLISVPARMPSPAVAGGRVLADPMQGASPLFLMHPDPVLGLTLHYPSQWNLIHTPTDVPLSLGELRPYLLTLYPREVILWTTIGSI